MRFSIRGAEPLTPFIMSQPICVNILNLSVCRDEIGWMRVIASPLSLASFLFKKKLIIKILFYN